MKHAYRISLPVLILSLVFILLGSSCGLGNIKGSISGTVYVDGRPQAFGTVQVFTADGQYIASERCTQTGHYIIQGLDAGTYEITYLNARGAPLGQVTTVEVRLGRFEPVDLQLVVQGN